MAPHAQHTRASKKVFCSVYTEDRRLAVGIENGVRCPVVLSESRASALLRLLYSTRLYPPPDLPQSLFFSWLRIRPFTPSQEVALRSHPTHPPWVPC